MDYTCERGAKRNFEPWRAAKLAEETEEERLDRLEREEAERDTMAELESKTLDAKTEMAIADALDEIRTRNARIESVAKAGGVVEVRDSREEEREKLEREDEEAARRAFMARNGDRVNGLVDDIALEVVDEMMDEEPAVALRAPEIVVPAAEPVSFKRVVKKKKDFAGALGIKKKAALV